MGAVLRGGLTDPRTEEGAMQMNSASVRMYIADDGDPETRPAEAKRQYRWGKHSASMQ
jgi:hypothetical protein